MTHRISSVSFALSLLTVLFVASLALAACGSSDGGDQGSGQTTVPTSTDSQSTGEEPGDGGAGQDSEPEAAAGDQRAVVTIGSETYEFEQSEYSSCSITEHGIFKATFVGEDGLVTGESFMSLEVSLPPDGLKPADLSMPWDAYPHVTIVIGESHEWDADAYESTGESTSNRNIPEGLTQVDSFQFDASGASGSATFLDVDNLTYDQDTSSYSGEPMTGSFEVSCG
ncbi:MAG: hypothetical protein WBM90_10500 [Acidimicrobiia bacterium]